MLHLLVRVHLCFGNDFLSCEMMKKMSPRGEALAHRNQNTMNNLVDTMVHCCADCGSMAEVDMALKACKSCMLVRYCNANCQRNHWPTHKTACKLRAAELRDEALFKDLPPKEDCPICFLPMPMRLICCVSLPPATISSVPMHMWSWQKWT